MSDTDKQTLIDLYGIFVIKNLKEVHQHYLKYVQIRSYFWSGFSCIRPEYGDLRSKSPYSVRIQENTDQK